MNPIVIDIFLTCIEAFYLLYLFQNEEKKKRNASWVLFLSFVVAVVCMSCIDVPVGIKLLIEIIIIMLIGQWTWEISLLKLGIYTITYIMAIVMSELIVVQVWNFFAAPTLSTNLVYDDFRISLIIVIKAVSFFVLTLVKNIFKPDMKVTEWDESYPIIFSGSAYLSVIIIVNINMVHIKSIEDRLLVLIGDGIILIAYILNIVCSERYIATKKLLEERKNKLMQLELQYDYYQRKKDDEEYVRKIYHDLKNHLLLMNVGEGVLVEVSNKLKKIENYYHTGNEFLDVIIHDKMQKADNKVIDLECEIDFSMGGFIEPIDISTIFGNLLDNAIEATENLEEEDRIIICKIKRKKGLLVVSIQNTYKCNALNKKKSKEYMHGFGLKNIQDAVAKYNGECHIFSDKNIFKVSIVLPIPNYMIEEMKDEFTDGKQINHLLCR